MNRHERRAARATADKAAAIMARAAFSIGRDHEGESRPLIEPLAIRALERGFRHLLRHGGAPHVLRLSEAEAAALTPWAPQPKGWEWYMAVGIDRKGRASYVSRPVKVEGVSAMEARRLIEAQLLADLQPILEDASPLPGMRR